MAAVENVQGDWQLLAQGAEARIYLARGIVPGEEESIVKERFEKAYRHKELDSRLTKQRFNGEIRSMIKAAKAGADVPRIDFIDKAKKRIVMEYVRGRTLKQVFDDAELTDETKLSFATQLGKAVGVMHDAGLAHGDLTTSNVMVRDGFADRLTVIDFGLAFSTKSAEDMGVDLYVLQRAFLSTHPKSEHLFDAVLDSYTQGGPDRGKVREHFSEVQQRGRKRVAFG